MELSIKKKRDLLGQFWRSRGTNGNRAIDMNENQVFVVFNRYLDEINIMLENIKNMNIYTSHMRSECAISTSHWSEEETNDYAFEE